jgi:hypothetical protein
MMPLNWVPEPECALKFHKRRSRSSCTEKKSPNRHSLLYLIKYIDPSGAVASGIENLPESPSLLNIRRRLGLIGKSGRVGYECRQPLPLLVREPITDGLV